MVGGYKRKGGHWARWRKLKGGRGHGTKVVTLHVQ